MAGLPGGLPLGAAEQRRQRAAGPRCARWTGGSNCNCGKRDGASWRGGGLRRAVRARGAHEGVGGWRCRARLRCCWAAAWAEHPGSPPLADWGLAKEIDKLVGALPARSFAFACGCCCFASAVVTVAAAGRGVGQPRGGCAGTPFPSVLTFPAPSPPAPPQKQVHLRQRAGIRADSPLEILAAERDMYVARIGSTVTIKLGPRYDMGNLVPRKEEGWQLAASGKDWAVWEKQQ